MVMLAFQAVFSVLFGAALFGIGANVVRANLKNVKRRQRIVSTPTTPIAHAPGDALVEIKGRIAPSEMGVVQTPFSRRQAVWCRITVQELRWSGENRDWHTILTEVDGRPFLVDDGSGQLARVMPQGANVILDKHRIASSGLFNDAAPHLEAFLQSRGLKSTSWIGFNYNKGMRYEEEVLAPGDPLYALGPSQRQPGPPVHDGYRMVLGSQLVLFHGMGAELLLTNKTEDQLTSKLRTGFIVRFIVGAVICGLGLLLGFSGIVVAVLGEL